MDGITILNTYMAYTRSMTALLLFTGLFCCVFIVLGFILKVETDSNWGCLISSISVIVLIYSLIYTPQTKHYQAIVDDSVPWIELTDKYEVITVEGKILTMIEKEKKDE